MVEFKCKKCPEEILNSLSEIEDHILAMHYDIIQERIIELRGGKYSVLSLADISFLRTVQELTGVTITFEEKESV